MPSTRSRCSSSASATASTRRLSHAGASSHRRTSNETARRSARSRCTEHQGMTEGSDGFLARWSRRKFEVRREEAQPPAPEGAPANREPELTPEEIAALPKIEELTPETDISAFLRRG